MRCFGRIPVGQSQFVRWLVLTAAAGAALLPLLSRFGVQTWAKEHYRFGPLALLAAAVLGYRSLQIGNAAPLEPSGLLAQAAVWAFAVTVSAVALLLDSPFLAALAAFGLVVASAMTIGGMRLLWRLGPAGLIALLTVPPPFAIDEAVIRFLQRTATTWASGVLDLANVPHLPDGVAIRLPGRDFFVDEACSGVHSLFAAFAFTGTLSVIQGHGPLRAALLLSASAGWVVAANALRVFAVVLLSTSYDWPIDRGTGHELLGITVFASVAGLVVSTERLLRFLVPGDPRVIQRLLSIRMAAKRRWPDDAGPRSFPRSISAPRPSWILSIATIAFAVLAASHFAAPVETSAADRPLLAADDRLKALPVEALPAMWNGWRRVAFEVRRREPGDPAGELSRVWVYAKGRLTAAVSIDGPYRAWHDLEDCYRNLGYRASSARDLPVPEGGDGEPHFTELRVENESGSRALVLFMGYTGSDTPLPASASRPGPISRRLAAVFESGDGRRTASAQVYQVQLYAESRLDFSEGEQAELVGLFHEMRERIRTAEANDRPQQIGATNLTEEGIFTSAEAEK